MSGFISLLIILSVILIAFSLRHTYKWYKQFSKNIELIDCIEYCDAAIIKDLIRKGADVNGHDENKQTPLIVAIKNKKLDIIELLLNEGANINQPDNRKNTPLMYAVCYGNLEIVRLLISRGANLHSKNEDGFDALSIANKLGKKDIANEIRSYVETC